MMDLSSSIYMNLTNYCMKTGLKKTSDIGLLRVTSVFSNMRMQHLECFIQTFVNLSAQ